MKNSAYFLGLFAFLFMVSSCSKDDPMEENEEEVITTLTLTLTDGSTVKTIQFRDEDGDGGTPSVLTVDTLDANTTYGYTAAFLNETETPAEVITTEIAEEDDEHQLFFVASGGLNLTHAYGDQDDDGNPVGLAGTITTGDASQGSFVVTLRHEPIKDATGVSDGDITNAGGETDIEVDFTVVIQ